MEEFDLIYNILNQKGIGRVKANKIIQKLENVFISSKWDKEILTSGLKQFFDPEVIEDIITKQNSFNLKINTQEPFFTHRFSKKYPDSLKKMGSNCPPVLSCMGNINLLEKKKVGFCGSRKASEKGISVAKDISQQVAAKNIVVVSGYASGIDQETHYWALKEGGETIIVLPEGIENFSIKKHVKEVWDWNRILVISEFIPNAIWSVNRAMQRNTTIISLSDIMFLIEAKVKGGSIDAGHKTLAMNKPLFAPVYDGMPDEASGNQLLLTKGALPLRKKRETNKANLDKVFEILNKPTTNSSLFE